MTDVDLGSPEAIQDPAGHFARARQHAGAVQWSRALRAWVLLSHAEIEEGFRDTNGDGWLEKSGKRFEFDLITNHGQQLRSDILVMVQDMLRKTGITP